MLSKNFLPLQQINPLKHQKMKTTKLILCFVALSTMFLVGCKKDTNNSLSNTRWSLFVPDDPAALYLADVTYTLDFGKSDVVFTRKYDYGDMVETYTLEGTYTYSNGSGVAMIHENGDTTDYRITFTVTGNTLVWRFNLRDIALIKQ
jgi:hypothetical protein